MWSSIRLRGHTRAGIYAPGWESQTEMRNTSFVPLPLNSWLRRKEAGALLTFELPTQRLHYGRYCGGI